MEAKHAVMMVEVHDVNAMSAVAGQLRLRMHGRNYDI